MKRGGPLKRRKSLSRQSELKPDPDKVREFIQRGRGKLARGEQGLRKTRRNRPAEGPLDPASWAVSVIALSGGRSIVSRARVTDDPPHHVIPKQELRRRRLDHLVWDPRNGVAVTLAEHAAHESGERRIRRAELPRHCFDFAAECGEWAMAYIDRIYPTDRGGQDG